MGQTSDGYHAPANGPDGPEGPNGNGGQVGGEVKVVEGEKVEKSLMLGILGFSDGAPEREKGCSWEGTSR